MDKLFKGFLVRTLLRLMRLQNFLRLFVSVVSRRFLLFVVLNWLFFGGMFVGALFGRVEYGRLSRWPLSESAFRGETVGLSLLIVGIFLFNLIVSGFFLVTLSGLLFFALPIGFLLFRGVVWGALLTGLPTPLFLAAFPTLLLEGEGYVLGGVAGVNLGLSWLKPEWVYEGGGLSRLESVKKALRDCLRVYVLVALVLFMAAVVEVLTVIFIL